MLEGSPHSNGTDRSAARRVPAARCMARAQGTSYLPMLHVTMERLPYSAASGDTSMALVYSASATCQFLSPTVTLGTTAGWCQCLRARVYKGSTMCARVGVACDDGSHHRPPPTTHHHCRVDVALPWPCS